jgi:hypothetical protein
LAVQLRDLRLEEMYGVYDLFRVHDRALYSYAQLD